MFLALSSTKVFKRIKFHEELWLPWQPKDLKKNLKKSSCQKPQGLEP